jgi:signal transduction histidine kinase/CheY-like chemotaxis protein
MIPLVVLVIGYNLPLFFLSWAFHLIFLWTKLKTDIAAFLGSYAPEELANKFIVGCTLISCLVMMVLVLNELAKKKIYTMAVESSKVQCAYTQQNNFLLSLSHEVRNPLNSLLGNIELSLLEIIPKDVQEYLTNSKICGDLLLHLLNNILDSGKAEIGDLEVQPYSCDILGLLEKLWVVSCHLISQKGLFGEVMKASDIPPNLKLDPYRITQVLLNLIGNSVKFTETGMISIKAIWIPNKGQVTEQDFEPRPYNEEDENVHEKNKNIDFYLTKDQFQSLTLTHKHFENPSAKENGRDQIGVPGILKIIVEDTGCGITEADQKILFTKFTQLSSDSRKKQIGTGLGLYITRELVKKMNGEIRVFSKVNVGTCFIVCIPTVSCDPVALQRINLSPRRERNEPRKALVADDVELCIKILDNYLKKIGYSPTSAMNGLEAYEKYVRSHQEGKRFHVVTMDYDMPVLNGKDAVTRIRDYERANNMKPSTIMMISGHCNQSIISECVNPSGNVRANYFLKKPVTYQQIFDIVHKSTN